MSNFGDLTRLKKVLKFPYSKVVSINQCVKAFEYLTKEIGNIAEDIDIGIDLILFSNILRETINLNDYKKVTQNIELRINKINMISNLINNFLVNNVTKISNHVIQNKQIVIHQCVRLINFDTSGLIAGADKYNEGDPIDTPSIDIWIDVYKKSVIIFNQCVDRWNQRFNTHIERAETP
jgi:hypothetical protein